MKTILVIFASFLFAGELEVDGDLKVTGTVDANGNPIVSVDPASAGWMGPAEYAQSLQSNEKFNSFFKANVTTGGSGNSTAGGIKGAQLLNRVEFDKLDYIDRDKAVKSNPDHYNKFLD